MALQQGDAGIVVTFLPGRVQVIARRGDTLLDAALDNGVPLEHECGGNCTCTTCHVVAVEGWWNLSDMEAPEDERLETAPEREAMSRLACQALLRGPVTVMVGR